MDDFRIEIPTKTLSKDAQKTFGEVVSVGVDKKAWFMPMYSQIARNKVPKGPNKVPKVPKPKIKVTFTGQP